MAEDYRICDICGSQYPHGHPCMNCVTKNNLKKGEFTVTPEKMSEHVKILRFKKDDILLVKVDEDFNKLDHESLSTCLSEMDVLVKNNVEVILVPINTDLVIVRKEKE